MSTAAALDHETALHRLARRHGVAPVYEDAWHETVAVDAEVLVAVLQALDVPIGAEADAARLLETEDTTALVEPVVVAEAGRRVTVPLSSPVRGRWVLRRDDEPVADGAFEGDRVELPSLDVGFWDVELDTDAGTATTRILAAPSRAHATPALSRCWGIFAPLHAVAHPDRAGHLGDVRLLADAIAGYGGRIVAVLPLLATFLGDDPHEPSPYQPVSRRFGSELFLDPDRLPVRPALDLPPAPPDGDGLVDHRALQRRADALVAHVVDELRDDTDAARRLDRFRHDNPEVEDYARFRAAVERHGPAPVQLDGAPERIEHHVVAQWLLDEQLRSLRADLDARGQALALDLPIGSHPDGFDVHRRRDEYAVASVGAPPDTFFRAGQDWGFPPPHPVTARAGGHRELAGTLLALARYAGVLRIDHVLGLHRLWWIPPGFPASRGAYVHYPLDELLAVVRIVSHLTGTVMVGENLGTVPPVVTEALAGSGVLGMHEEQFVIGDPDDELPPVPPATVAGINTHDMAPFAGFWDAHDIREQAALGQLDPADVDALTVDRRTAITRYRELVADELDRPVPDDRAAVYAAAVERLARSDAEQVMIDIEDLWGETESQNVPGTHTERPNWRRRFAHPLARAFDDPGAQPVLDALATIRGPGGDPT